jgi:23S rRNA pseudouridine2605 synthase
MPKMRINRARAQAGVASRRGAEELIRAGRVKINGAVVTVLATQVDLQRDKILLDNKPLVLAANVYYAYYKPRGIVCTQSDERGRDCVGDICAKLVGAPRPVGRLDRASEGLLVLTNDGSLALRLTHPRYGVEKEYQATVSPKLTERHARQLIAGVELDDGIASFTGIDLLAEEGDRSRLKVTVAEGRYRLIRRAFEVVGHEVLRLKRVRIGPLSLGKLEVGATRELTKTEVLELKRQLKLLT